LASLFEIPLGEVSRRKERNQKSFPKFVNLIPVPSWRFCYFFRKKWWWREWINGRGLMGGNGQMSGRLGMNQIHSFSANLVVVRSNNFTKDTNSKMGILYWKHSIGNVGQNHDLHTSRANNTYRISIFLPVQVLTDLFFWHLNNPRTCRWVKLYLYRRRCCTNLPIQPTTPCCLLSRESHPIAIG
jgi:hypothetical protein